MLRYVLGGTGFLVFIFLINFFDEKVNAILKTQNGFASLVLVLVVAMVAIIASVFYDIYRMKYSQIKTKNNCQCKQEKVTVFKKEKKEEEDVVKTNKESNEIPKV